MQPAPPDYTPWALMFVSFAPCLALVRMDQIWTLAVHRGITMGVTADLNKISHALATDGFSTASHGQVLPSTALHYSIVFMHHVSIVL